MATKDEVGSSRTMLVGKARSEYEFIIVLDRLDDQSTIFELIVQDDAVVWRNSDVKWWSGVTPGLRRWSGRTPASGGGPAELRRQVVVRWNSGPQVVVWCNSGPQVVVRQNSDVRRWSSGSPTSSGGPTKLQRRMVIQQNSDVSCSIGKSISKLPSRQRRAAPPESSSGPSKNGAWKGTRISDKSTLLDAIHVSNDGGTL
ncbi:hypothetical protein M5K25_000940 [Dendrobium thyrsiflorum]|uniref:Uncharacterized protein n=1 Tax=Dendrobium thyrsiflorum TaxID=117978 RepID=A0ABD0W9R0_DENTH